MKIAVELPEDIADRLEDKWEDLSEARAQRHRHRRLPLRCA